ncbi:MAG: acetylglutamate kinase [Polyangiales bacterium]
MDDLIEKAKILQEALPYIREFHGDMFVIKYGGNAMVDPELRDSFARDVVLMKYVGLHPVVVHGGGPQIDETLTSLGVVSERLDGLRVTDQHTMEVVEMVLGGKLNQEIVSLIAGHGGRAIGLTGKDDGFIRAKKVDKMKTKSGQWVDPGRVGAVTQVNPDILRRLVNDGFIPVVAPIAVDAEGKSLNVNADTVAGKIAEALPARKFVLLTDIEGVRGKDGTVASSLSASEIDQLKADGVIEGGMIPKVDCALGALAGGVRKAHVIDGRVRHAVLLEIFTDEGIGTEITR